jgi:hypothetical protein
MSVPPRPAPPNRLLLPVLAAVAYLASVIAVFGFLSLGLNRDVIDVPDAGPLLGPVMVTLACAVTLAALVALLRPPRRRAPWPAALETALGVYLTMIVAGAIGYAWDRGELIWLVLFAAREAASPFVISAAVLAGLFAVAFWAVSDRTPSRPR